VANEGPNISAGPQEFTMQTYEPSLIARPDTLLGVCEAIGTDLGFNPIYLRVALATVVFFNLALAVGIYLGAGVIVVLTRWAHPSPRKLMVVKQTAPTDETEQVRAENDQDALLLAAAA